MPKFLEVTNKAAARLAVNAQPGTAISVLDYEADPTGVVDSAEAIQNAINAARDVARASGIPQSVVIPAGVYRTNSKIVQPPYVKVSTSGNVIIESYVGNDSAWHLTPLSDDPSTPFRAGQRHGQWMGGPPLSGQGGGLTFINKAAIGLAGNATGLELGSRTDLGVHRQLARYRLTDIAIQDYRVGLKWNPFNHYIASYDRVHIAGNAYCVVIGTDNTGENYGENVSWNDCLFAQTSAADEPGGPTPMFLWNQAGCDMNFFGCSFDFTALVFKFNYGYQRVNVVGGHIEGINYEPDYYVPTGGIANALDVSPSQAAPEVQISNVTFLPQTRSVQFRGELNLDLDFNWRGIAITSDALTWEDSYLCDSAVNVLAHRVRHINGGQSVARQCNLVIDPVFAADNAGTSGSSLTYWSNEVNGGVFTHEVDSDGPLAGGKSLRLTMGASAYSRYTTRTYLPCKPGDILLAKMAYKFSAATPAAILAAAVSWFDSEKVQIGSTVEEGMFRTHTLTNTWAVPDGHQPFTAPPGACFFRIGFQISTPSGNSVVTYRISDFHVYLQN